MDIAYTAHTETCTLLLDAEGICRSVLAVSSRVSSNGGARPTQIPPSAEKCVGAQYVATIDLRESGGMTAMPKPGSQMLFARTEKTGRITLIRSARVVRFEATAAPAKSESGVHDRTKVTYGDDEETTIPCDPPTLVAARRSSLPPPPAAPVRNSGVVPAGTARQTPIPPPPRAPHVDPPDSITRPTPVPRRPFGPTSAAPAPRAQSTYAPVYAPPVAYPSAPRSPRSPRATGSEWDVETRPFRRASR